MAVVNSGNLYIVGLTGLVLPHFGGALYYMFNTVLDICKCIALPGELTHSGDFASETSFSYYPH